MAASEARHPRSAPLWRIGLDPLVLGIQGHIIIPILHPPAVLPLVPRRLPLLSQPLSKPPAIGKIVLPLRLQSVIASGKITSTRIPSLLQMMRSVRNWMNHTADAPLPRTACRLLKYRATAPKMVRILVALMTATTRRKQPTIPLRCLQSMQRRRCLAFLKLLNRSVQNTTSQLHVTWKLMRITMTTVKRQSLLRPSPSEAALVMHLRMAHLMPLRPSNQSRKAGRRSGAALERKPRYSILPRGLVPSKQITLTSFIQ